MSGSVLPYPGESTPVMINGDNSGGVNHSWKDTLNVAIITLFIVIGGMALILLLSLHPNTESSEEYGVVFDAGSSHTAVYVYKWPGDYRLYQTAVPVDEVYTNTKHPGISSFAYDPTAAGPSLKGLITDAVNVVPHDKRSSTSIYLGATAGMRLVNETNQTVSEQIMSSVSKALSESGFSFADGDAKIISGEDEGSFGWITVNYLDKILQAKNKSKLTYGALDLGGASTQISFVPKSASQGTKYMHLELYGRDHPVYSKTYLCYGLNEIYRRFLAELAKNANYSTNVSNPCDRQGTSFSRNATYLWGAPCSCQPNASSMSLVPSNFTFYGTSNSSECGRQVARLFTFNTTCPHAKIFSRRNQPPLTGNFLAFSAYYYVAHSLNLSTKPTMKRFRSAYQTTCNKTRNEAKQQQVPHLCFAAHYIFALLTEGFGFNDTTWKISFEKSVGGKSLGWSLGYMINATNLIPRSEPENKRLDDDALIPAAVICGVFILIGFLLLLHFIRRKRRGNKSSPDYSRI